MEQEADNQLFQPLPPTREPKSAAGSQSSSSHLLPAAQEAADLSLPPLSRRAFRQGNDSQPLSSPAQQAEVLPYDIQAPPTQPVTSQDRTALTAQTARHHSGLQSSSQPVTPPAFQKSALIASTEIAHEPDRVPVSPLLAYTPAVPEAASSQVPTSDPQFPAVEQGTPAIQQRTLHDEQLTTHITPTTSTPILHDPIAMVREEVHFIEDQKRLLQKSSGLQAPVSQDETIPTIQVMIGRIEVQVTPSPITPAQSSRQKPMSLDHYLEQRSKGGRS
jgi:hypothetical protein